MKLRDYQEQILVDVEADRAFGTDKMIVSLCTGGGKSLVISSLCNQYPDEKIMILTNITKLINQIADHLDEVGIDYSILKAGMEDKYDESKRVQLVMEQTLHARDITLAADIVIKDEMHIGWNGDRYKSIVASSGCSLEIGFSATPYNQAGVALPDYDIVKGLTTKQATESGYLTAAKTYVARFTKDISLDDIGKSGDYSANELDDVINTPEYNSAVVSAFMQLPEQPSRAIVFVSGIEHSDDLAAAFNATGINAKSVHSKNVEEATFESDDLLNSSYRVIVSVSKLSTGFDDTSIDTVINCRPTKVKSLYYQMVGRSLRLHPGQDHVQILDCAKATAEHGFYDLEYEPLADKKAAKKMQESMKIPEMDYILSQDDGSDVFYADPVGIEATISRLSSDESLEGLTTRYDLCIDMRECLVYASKINHLIGGVKINDSTIDWIMEEVESGVEEFGIKPFRTRLKNILKKGGKPAGLRYFPKWLRENRRY